MKKKYLSLICALPLFALVATNATAAWQFVGPDGTKINDLYCSKTEADTVYAATDSGVFFTTDSGNSWESMGLTLRGVETLYESACGQRLFAASDNVIFIKNEDGSWSSSYTPEDVTVLTETVDSSGGTPVCTYFTGTEEGVYATNQDVELNEYEITALAPSHSSMYAGTEENGIHKSNDNGETWQALTGPSSSLVADLYVDQSDNLYAATIDGGIVLSTDGGNIWTEKNTGLPDTFASISSVQITGSGSNILFSSVVNELFPPQAAIYRSANQGDNWQKVSNDVNMLANAMCTTTDNKLYVSTGNSIFRTDNNGDSWTDLGNKMNVMPVKNFVENAGHTIFMAPDDATGIYRSSDGGQTWELINNTLIDVDTLFVDRDGHTLYAGVSGTGGVFKSTDDGETWLPIMNGLPTEQLGSLTVYKEICSLGQDGNGRLYAGLENGLVYYSDDSGANWQQVSTLPLAGMDTDDEETFIIGADGSTVYAAIEDFGIYKSTDGGSSWSRADSGIPVTDEIEPESFYRAPNGDLYVGQNAWNYPGLYRSTDEGLNWHVVQTGYNTCPVNSITVDRNGTIYAVFCNQFISYSVNNGITGEQMNEGLPERISDLEGISPETIFADSQGNILLGTNKGIYRETAVIPPEPEITEAFLFTDNSPRSGWTIQTGIITNSTGMLFASVQGRHNPAQSNDPFGLYSLFPYNFLGYLNKGPYTNDWQGTTTITATKTDNSTVSQTSHVLDSPRLIPYAQEMEIHGFITAPDFSFNTVGNNMVDRYKFRIWDITDNTGKLVYQDTRQFSDSNNPPPMATFSVPWGILGFDRIYSFQAIMEDLDTEENGSPVENRSSIYSSYNTYGGTISGNVNLPIDFYPENYQVNINDDKCGNGYWLGSAMPNQSGQYEIDHIHPGEVYASLSIQGQGPILPPVFWSANGPVTDCNGAEAIDIDTGSNIENIDFNLTGTIHGRVNGPQGMPLAGIVIRAAIDISFAGSYTAETTTGENGEFSISLLAPGEIRLYTVDAADQLTSCYHADINDNITDCSVAAPLVISSGEYPAEVNFTLCGSDLDCDGDTDGLDLARMASSYNLTNEDEGYAWKADLDGNSRIDMADVEILLDSFGRPAAP